MTALAFHPGCRSAISVGLAEAPGGPISGRGGRAVPAAARRRRRARPGLVRGRPGVAAAPPHRGGGAAGPGRPCPPPRSRRPCLPSRFIRARPALLAGAAPRSARAPPPPPCRPGWSVPSRVRVLRRRRWKWPPGPVGTATRGTFAAARGRGRGPGVDRQWHRVGPRVRAERGARRVGRGDHQLPRADGRHARSDGAGRPAGPGANVDTTVPAAPAGLHVTGRSETSVSLDWATSVDNVKVAGYILVRNGKQIGTTRDPGYTDTGLAPHDQVPVRGVRVRRRRQRLARQRCRSWRPRWPSRTVRRRRFRPGCTPTGKSVTSIVLAWTASRDNVGVAGYEVYRDGALVANVGSPASPTPGSRPHPPTPTRCGRSTRRTTPRPTAPPPPRPRSPRRTPRPPSTPDGLRSDRHRARTTIDISWHAATDNVGVTGYRLFRGGVQIAVVPTTAYSDQGLTPATTLHLHASRPSTRPATPRA